MSAPPPSAATTGSRGPLFLGDFHPDLESAFAARLAALAPGGDARGLLIVVPNRLLGVHLRRRAAELGTPTLGLNPRSLEDLTAELAAPVLAKQRLRALDGWELPLLIGDLLGPRLRRPESYFASAAGKRGLLRALAGTLRDLRDAGVDSVALAKAAAGMEPKLEELAALYGELVAGLQRRGLADAAARATAAVEALAAGGDGAPIPRQVLVYGFYDVVERQRRVLAALLRGRAAEVFFPWGEGPAFAYAEPLLHWFKAQGFAPPESRAEGALAALPDDLAALRSGLFADTMAAAPQPRAAGARSVRLLSVPSPAREPLEVLRRMVAAPTRTAGVLLRSEEEARAFWTSARRATGVPLHFAAADPWPRRPAGRATRLLLSLAASRREEKPVLARTDVEDLLGSGALDRTLYERGSRPERWTQLLRRRGLVADLGSWERLCVHAQAQADPPAPAAAAAQQEAREEREWERDPLLRRELPALGAFVARLLADTALLAAPAPTWASFWGRLRLTLERWLRAGEERDSLLAALAPLGGLDGVVPFDWDAARLTADTLLSLSAPAEGRFGSAPTVAGLATLRGLTFDRVVLPGLVERTFPRRAQQDPILLDEERERLNGRMADAAIPLKLARAVDEERLLFRLAAGAARSELILSWPRHAADGRALVPSSFALAAARALLGREVLFEELESDADPLAVERVPLSPLARTAGKGRSPVPEAPPLLAWEFDLIEIARVAAAAHRSRATPELSYLLAAYPGLGPTLAAVQHRRGAGTRHRLTAWDGLVDPRLAAAWIARRQAGAGGLAALPISASGLEAYAHCSFRFFHQQVLRLESAPPPERRLDLDPRDIGALVHAALEALYARLEREQLLPLAPGARLAAAQSLVAPVLDAVAARNSTLVEEAPVALWRVRRRRLIEDLQGVLAREATPAAGTATAWRPYRREWEFGLGGAPPVEIAIGAERLALRGRLDRVDAAPGAMGPLGIVGKPETTSRLGMSGRLRVVDYKTGRLDKKQTPDPPSLLGGQRLQLPLYRLAAAALTGTDPAAIEAEYLGVERQSGFRTVRWTPEHFATAQPQLERVVGAVLSGLRAGEFFQIERGDFCDELCAFGDICGPGRKELIAAKELDSRAAAALLWRGGDDET